MALVLAAVLLALMNQKDGYGKSLNTFAGRYIAYGTKFYNCDQTQLPTSDKPTWNWYLRFTHHFNPLKPEELQRFDGNVTGLEEVNDNCWVHLLSHKEICVPVLFKAKKTMFMYTLLSQTSNCGSIQYN
ncbi:uncharacterized protein LOC113217572 isoform X3 [Frankliniella occidentalis]|uniref:Uncharacterized protein LOC113217572 isoform X3 n=1 Tax=Frankliniella occidentalis TaxID=133901 RepID=A0A6J1TJ62_FRAOC|nr:uncharacterized protein LOC113217572 isoform X3 [Frankliniella occidentalis]XP_026293314.1 uncharacterized protein LOC113217572 isoform X3 [Frankliniella occidentalis]